MGCDRTHLRPGLLARRTQEPADNTWIKNGVAPLLRAMEARSRQTALRSTATIFHRGTIAGGRKTVAAGQVKTSRAANAQSMSKPAPLSQVQGHSHALVSLVRLPHAEPSILVTDAIY